MTNTYKSQNVTDLWDAHRENKFPTNHKCKMTLSQWKKSTVTPKTSTQKHDRSWQFQRQRLMKSSGISTNCSVSVSGSDTDCPERRYRGVNKNRSGRKGAIEEGMRRSKRKGRISWERHRETVKEKEQRTRGPPTEARRGKDGIKGRQITYMSFFFSFIFFIFLLPFDVKMAYRQLMKGVPTSGKK